MCSSKASFIKLKVTNVFKTFVVKSFSKGKQCVKISQFIIIININLSD